MAARAKPRSKARSKSPPPITYAVHPGVAMVQKWVAELKQKTGRTLEEWCAHIQKDGPTDLKHPEVSEFDPPVRDQRVDDRVERPLDDFLGLQLGQLGPLGNPPDDLFLGHG